ncbi:AGE family epimerase/isomerase [Maricaulis sp. CAU 1757]
MQSAPGSLVHTARLAEWGPQSALPFWIESAWDKRHGGFYETLEFSGEGRHGDIRRVRTQARQIYVFARAHVEGWPTRLELVHEGLGCLKARAWGIDGKPGWVHTLADDGEVIDGQRDLYDQAFLILALAWAFRATGDGACLDLAWQTLDFVEGHLGSPHGGFQESLGGDLLPRRQNPHMHMFEALLALHEATGEDRLLERLHGLRRLFEQHFLDRQSGVLREHFDQVWDIDAGVGHIVEPGHMCEWSWLLRAYTAQTGYDMKAASDLLFGKALEIGRMSTTGLMRAAVAADGRVVRPGARAWMQTEWVAAAASQYLAGETAQDLETAAESLMRYHLDPAPTGCWVDCVDETGRADCSGIPSSTLYHLLGSSLAARNCLAGTGATATR